MIQRIQSLYLVLIMGLSAALFVAPIYSLELPIVVNGSVSILPRFFYSTSNVVYTILDSLIFVMGLIILLLYKNRNLQVRLCNLNLFLICIFTGTIFYFADHSKENAEATVHYLAGCYFPLIQLVLSVLAIRAIRKDEKLVRSADRLR